MDENVINMKYIMLGDSSVGKTCIIYKYVDNFLPSNYNSTIGIDCKIKLFEYKGYKMKLTIYDTAGQERFRTIIKNYFHNCDGIFLVFDLTNKNSFNNLKSWIDEIKESKGKDFSDIVILGNKCDLSNIYQVSDEDIDNFKEENNIDIIKTSAKNYWTTKSIRKND